MKHRKIIPSILMIIIFAAIFINGYAAAFSVPVYAAAPTGYVPANTDEELSESFNDYCKSRNAEFTAQLPGAMKTYVYNLMVKGAYSLEEDLDTIQSSLFKKSTDDGKWSWYLNSTVMNFYNRLFDFLLGENDLEVGDTANVQMYHGAVFTDSDGYSVLSTQSTNDYVPSSQVALGGYYKYPTSVFVDYFNSESYTNTYYSKTYDLGLIINTSIRNTITLSGYKDREGILYRITNHHLSTGANRIYGWLYGNYAEGFISVSDNGYGAYFPCVVSIRKSDGYISVSTFGSALKPYSDDSTQSITINFVTIDNKTINNNVHEGDTIINNEGDIINEGPNYDPYPNGGGSTTPPSSGVGGSGSDGTINFPDLDFNLPEINWSLGDLSQKFPFSIPFDLISFFTLINAEPEAPRIDAEIPLGTWYTWEFEADFSQFENYAVIIRNVEFIGFCIGLIYLTIRLVKG